MIKKDALTSKTTYLTARQFMARYVILTYSIIPRDKKLTHVKGWKDVPNSTQYNESISFKNNIKTSDTQTAKLILDTRDKTVVKNGFPEDVPYDKAMDYLRKHYPNYFPAA